MRKKLFRLWMLALPMLLGLASCAEHDNPADPNPLADKVAGMWYAQYDEEGKTFTDIEYTRVIQVLKFSEDGTGWWSLLFFDDEESEPIDRYGGKSSDGGFTYTTSTDGTVTFKLGDEWDMDYYPNQLRATCKDGKIIVVADGKTYEMEHPSEAMAAWLEENSTGGASADTYNINDEDFTPDTWREQEAIYIYDGTGKDVTDAKGRTGYTLVNMPWYKGDVLTNLPEGFCDDITPENGWEWALNRCGSRSIVNNNFFAVYNKYTGILRFFYYLPYGFNTGNDHVWQVSMTDHLAQQSNWKYGVPQDKTIVDKTAIGQTGSGTFMDYVTPWVDYMSPDGLIVPNAGWWAFDVDLSQRRADGFTATDNIKLQMRSWTTQHVSLTSAVTAKIDGSMLANFDLTKTNVSSAKGLFESFSDIKGIGSGIFNAVKSAISGNYIDAIKTGIGVAKDGYTLYGAMTKETTTSVDTLAKGSLTGTLNLAMAGNIDTEGTIRGSVPTVGIASPTFYLKDFDTQNSHVGQGVWNLKSSPVIYLTNQRMWMSGALWGDDKYPNVGCVYLFDPTSVEVELNPDVFPAGQIEWMEVNAIPGTRISNKVTGTDYYRRALGLADRHLNQACSGIYYVWTFPVSTASELSDVLADFFYDQSETYGAQYSRKDKTVKGLAENVGGDWQAVYGRGYVDEYILEPQLVSERNWDCCIAPPLEINVTVRVKLAGMNLPIVYSRVYLPEVKYISPGQEDLEAFARRINYYQLSPLQNDHRQFHDYLVKRAIAKCRVLAKANITLADNYIPIAGTGDTGAGGFDKLLDGDTETKWCVSRDKKKDGVYFVEFESKEPIEPTKYYLTTGGDTQKYPERNPKSWKLMAKASEGDAWTTIATVTGGSTMPAANCQRVEFSLDVTGKQWQYFRFEISEVQGDNWMQLSEFDFGN